MQLAFKENISYTETFWKFAILFFMNLN